MCVAHPRGPLRRFCLSNELESIQRADDSAVSHENRSRQLGELQDGRILYLEPDETDPTDYAVVRDQCVRLGYRDSDSMFNESYALPLVQRILDGMNASIDLSATPPTHVLLVDCDYTGRHYEDSTMLKIFLVDVGLHDMWSFALQTTTGVHERTHLETHLGAVIVAYAELRRFRLGADDDPDLYGLAYDGSTDYYTLVALHFPYEAHVPFVETARVSPTDEFTWRIQSTNESIVYQMYAGYYRGSHGSQTNAIRFYLTMSGNPVRDFATDLYSSTPFSKDALAWIHGLVVSVMGAWSGLNVVVALNIALSTLITKRELFLPDVFPTIKRHVRLRAIALFAAFLSNDLWSIHEWALNAAFVRYQLIALFVSRDLVRSDFLVFFLLWTDWVATALNVGIWPVVPIATFLWCCDHSDELVQALTSSQVEQDVADYTMQSYMQQSVVFSSFGMNMWTRYELVAGDPPTWFVAREFVWFIAPCVGITCGLVLYKAALVMLHKLTGGRQYQVQTSDVDDICVPFQHMASVEGMPLVFVDNFLPRHDGLPTRGLMTHAPPLFLLTKDSFQMSRSHLWSSGWLILDDKYLLYMDDLPSVVAHVLTGVPIGLIYCCNVMTDEDDEDGRCLLVPQLVALPVSELTWRSLLRMSVDNLWVKKEKPGEGQRRLQQIVEKTTRGKTSSAPQQSHRHQSTKICTFVSGHTFLSNVRSRQGSGKSKELNDSIFKSVQEHAERRTNIRI
ncbi:hypothetical protein AeMF1_016104 [Aphanomyces euteiches]|nr:hypothetical protein AeMF1_016104 [Aphanomyces euteiches]